MGYYITSSPLTQFVAATVHTADAHNVPHNHLLANDVALDAALYTTNGNIGQLQTTASLLASRIDVLESIPVIFTKSYISPGQLITTAGTLTLTHGFGVLPKVISYTLRCVTADAGFSPGDYLDANNFTYSAGGGMTSGLSNVFDTNTLTICYANIVSVFIAIHKTGRYGANLTNSSWLLIVSAFA